MLLETSVSNRGNATLSQHDIIQRPTKHVVNFHCPKECQIKRFSLNIVSGFKKASWNFYEIPLIYFQVLIVLEEPPY